MIIENAFDRHLKIAEKSKSELMPKIQQAANMLVEAVREGKKMLVCGNGGSAADSQHFAAEWMCKYKDNRRPLPAIALTTDTSALTAIGNDINFESIFSRQVEALGTERDVLVVFTTSGMSKNVVAAIEQARKQRMKIIALTGEGGAALKERVDVLVAVPSRETARIQEVHEIIYHAWCEYIDAKDEK